MTSEEFTASLAKARSILAYGVKGGHGSEAYERRSIGDRDLFDVISAPDCCVGFFIPSDFELPPEIAARVTIVRGDA